MTEEELQELRDKAAAFDFLCSEASPRYVRSERRIRKEQDSLLHSYDRNSYTLACTYDTVHLYEVRFAFEVLSGAERSFREAVEKAVKAQSARKPSGPR